MLDSRAPPTQPEPTQYDKEEEEREKAAEAEVQMLIKETRLWRISNSAQWVAWGIVQAKVPGLPDGKDGSSSANQVTEPASESPTQVVKASVDSGDLDSEKPEV